MNNVVSTRLLTRVFHQGDAEITAVNQVSLDIFEGDFVTIVGASGSGKTTLLNMIGCIDQPTSGEVFIDGVNITAAKDQNLSAIRREKISFVHQDFQLVPILTVEENIVMPLLLDGRKADQSELKRLAERLGIADRMKHFPSELSGGQQQRVAIARALITHPSIILADEPTGNLDRKSAENIVELLTSLNQDGNTILMVTHNDEYAKLGSRRMKMTDGTIEELT